MVKKSLSDGIKGVEIDQQRFEPHSVLPGHPHLRGVIPYLK